jgi:hypothetical protein
MASEPCPPPCQGPWLLVRECTLCRRPQQWRQRLAMFFFLAYAAPRRRRPPGGPLGPPPARELLACSF